MKVNYFYREKRKGNYSIELLFTNISKYISNTCEVKSLFFQSHDWLGKFKECLLLQKQQGDVNHITGDVNFLALFLSPIKTIITVHDLGHFENLLKKKWSIKYWVYRYCWMYWPLKRVRYVTCISEYSKNKLLQYFNIDPLKVVVINNPVTENFVYNPKEFNSDCPVILCVGTAPHKNLERLVLSIEGVKCKLLIIGRISEALNELLRKSNVSYSNLNDLSLEDLVKGYIDSDIVYFASLHEGFGMPIIEANAIGRPVITSNRCSMPEVASDAACIVDPMEVNQIREAIVKIISDINYRNTLVASGLENIKRFQLDVIGRKYLDLYRSVK